MKKILFLFLIIAAVSVNAQTASPFGVNARAKGDTLTNADTLVKTFTSTAGYLFAAVQLNVKKISGTVAGTIKIEGSADNGSNFITLTTANDTLTNTSNTKAYVFTYSPAYYDHYKVTVITSGTVSAKLLPFYTLKVYAIRPK